MSSAAILRPTPGNPRCASGGHWLWLALLILAGCSPPTSDHYQGYLEGEYLEVAAPSAGRLERLGVQRGDAVTNGQFLFQLEIEPESSATLEARQRALAAQSRLADARKGMRSSELAALEARLDQAQTQAKLSTVQRKRAEDLFTEGAISPDELDRVRSSCDSAQALVAELRSQIETARLGAREDAVKAAELEAEAANAALGRAEWALRQKSRASTANGVVQDTYYEPGEFVRAGSPVVSVLPEGKLKVRFFVAQEEIRSLTLGSQVKVSLGREVPEFNAEIRYISHEPEFTPPVIFSRETRAKLVYLVEAFPAQAKATHWHPGQPVEVRR